jgi:hypothetical protein
VYFTADRIDIRDVKGASFKLPGSRITFSRSELAGHKQTVKLVQPWKSQTGLSFGSVAISGVALLPAKQNDPPVIDDAIWLFNQFLMKSIVQVAQMVQAVQV